MTSAVTTDVYLIKNNTNGYYLTSSVINGSRQWCTDLQSAKQFCNWYAAIAAVRELASSTKHYPNVAIVDGTLTLKVREAPECAYKLVTHYVRDYLTKEK